MKKNLHDADVPYSLIMEGNEFKSEPLLLASSGGAQLPIQKKKEENSYTTNQMSNTLHSMAEIKLKENNEIIAELTEEELSGENTILTNPDVIEPLPGRCVATDGQLKEEKLESIRERTETFLKLAPNQTIEGNEDEYHANSTSIPWSSEEKMEDKEDDMRTEKPVDTYPNQVKDWEVNQSSAELLEETESEEGTLANQKNEDHRLLKKLQEDVDFTQQQDDENNVEDSHTTNQLTDKHLMCNGMNEARSLVEVPTPESMKPVPGTPSSTPHTRISTFHQASRFPFLETHVQIKQQLKRICCKNKDYFQPLKKASKYQKPNTAIREEKLYKPHDEKYQQQKKKPIGKELKQSPILSLSLDIDQLPWEVAFSEKVKNWLYKRDDSSLRKPFFEKVMILAQGQILANPKHCKSVSAIKGLELYETRLTDKIRILWQIQVQFSPRHTQGSDIKVYSEVIIVWDVVLDHDEINRSVKKIETNVHNRGKTASNKARQKLFSISKGNCVSGTIRNPRQFRCDNQELDKFQTETKCQIEYIPLINPKENQYNIAPLYSVSTSMIKLMLDQGIRERSFPFKESAQEHNIIQMSPERAILVLGRSGTGKTTCCFYRLRNEFEAYWSAPKPNESDFPPKQFIRSHQSSRQRDKTSCQNSLQSNNSDATNKWDHLHQVFLTKNYVLCNRLRRLFYKFASVIECAKHHVPFKDEEMARNFAMINDLAYPLFLTARQFYIMLDFSIQDGNYFFERDQDGKLLTKICSSDYDHEDPDSLYDLDGSDEEDGILLHELYSTAQEIEPRKPMREVTADYYKETIWQKDSNLSPLLVWTEIISFIKGSKEAIESEEGYLSENKYIELGKKRAPNFCAERCKIYALFEEYKKYLKRNRRLLLFDECDLVHNLVHRMKKTACLQWTFHSVYIDEVQDFTQGELWLILQTCQDPKGFFLTGDTAQTIMSGISFRFEDVKTLFHDLNALYPNIKVEVPPIFHLDLNYRSHSRLLNLAASITDIMKQFFPKSFDHEHIPRDEGIVQDGPFPILLSSRSAPELAMFLAGNKKKCASIDFGANQAILVRNYEAKKGLPDELKAAIVLTVFESKGLEFDAVLLYNFFTDSKVI